MIEVAEELNIPYQFDVTPGGATDAAKMHLAHDGAPAMSVGNCITLHPFTYFNDPS